MASYWRFGAFGRHVLVAVAMLVLSSTWARASEWVVSKASGQVWVASTRAQPVSLGTETALQPGDTIRTGGNGRVLLVRGEETILVAPNSVVALPDQTTSGLATTILQQAGSITIKAQKRDFNHFEVQTPYLAAVVKGTEFVVTIGSQFADVQVMSGRVDVTDFKTGQAALVQPGQAARSSAPGENGLHLRGSGTLNPVRQGQPGQAAVQPVDVPKTGLGSPPSKPGLQVHALTASAKQAFALPNGAVRIAAPIGSLKLDVHKATGGLARSEVGFAHSSTKATLWNTSTPDTVINNSPSNGGSYGLGLGLANGVGPGNGNGLGLGLGNGNGLGLGLNGGLGIGKGKGKGKS
jgi:hypothetical protein